MKKVGELIVEHSRTGVVEVAMGLPHIVACKRRAVEDTGKDMEEADKDTDIDMVGVLAVAAVVVA